MFPHFFKNFINKESLKKSQQKNIRNFRMFFCGIPHLIRLSFIPSLTAPILVLTFNLLHIVDI